MPFVVRVYGQIKGYLDGNETDVGALKEDSNLIKICVDSKNVHCCTSELKPFSQICKNNNS